MVFFLTLSTATFLNTVIICMAANIFASPGPLTMPSRGKDVPEDTRTAILVECAKYWSIETEKFPRRALAKIAKKFSPVSIRTIQRLWSAFKREQSNGNPSPKIGVKRKGKCGVNTSKLTDELRAAYAEVFQEYADMMLWLTEELCVLELKDKGFTVCQKTVSNHFRLMKSKRVNVRLKPSLTQAQTTNRWWGVRQDQGKDALVEGLQGLYPARWS